MVADLKDGRTKAQVAAVVQAVDGTLSSQGSSYDCQDYVLAILDGLVNNGIVDGQEDDMWRQEGHETMGND